MEIRVRDLMSTDLITLDKDETLDLASEVMKLARVRHLPVTDRGQLVGLVTHRDLLGALARFEGESAGEHQVPARSIMQKDMKVIGPDAPAREAAQIMQDNKYGCIPVVKEGHLIGILTEADFLDLTIRALEGL